MCNVSYGGDDRKGPGLQGIPTRLDRRDHLNGMKAQNMMHTNSTAFTLREVQHPVCRFLG